MPIVTVGKLSSRGASGAAAIATYYTRGIHARAIELTSGDLAGIASYYTADHLEHGGPYARWYGGSAERLGLVVGSECSAKQLRRVLQQLDPNDGSQLPNNGGRRATLSALDLTFSYEKDLAVLWMLGDEAARLTLEEIMDEASSESLGWMEQQTAVVRRGEGGWAHRSASGFLAVEVDHTTSRPVSGLAAPHLHRHVVIMVIVEEGGSWTALDSTRLFELQKAAGAIAGQRIRQLTEERLGLTWEQDDAGIFRVGGFDAELRNRLSLRQQQILEKAIAEGLDVTSRSDWVTSQRTSREGKNACGDDPQASQWAIEMLLTEGITYETVMQSIREARQSKDLSRADRTWIDATFTPPPADKLAASDWRLDVARALAARNTFGTLAGRTKEDADSPFNDIVPAWDQLEAAMAVDIRSREEVIHDALLSVGRERSTWRRKDLTISLCNAGVQLSDAEQEATAFLAGPESAYLYGLDDDPTSEIRIRIADQSLYATAETLEKESQLIAATRRGVGRMAPLLNEEQFGIVLSTMAQRGTSIATDSNQHEMLAALLRGQNQIELVCGQAGSGKTAGMTGLSVALEGGYLGETSPVHDDGIPRLRVVGCTLAANAAKNLQEQSGVTSFSITMLTHRLATGDVVLEAGALVIVDECSQASTAQLAQLWAHVERAGGRLVLMGDERQLQSVMAGGLYTTMLDSVPEATVTLDETRRQNNLEERAILATIHDRGRLREQSVKALAGQGVDPALIARLRARALDEVKDWYKENSRIVIHSSPAHAVAAIATSYWDAVEASGGDPAGAALVMARSNDEIRLLDRAIVEEAVLRQHLDPDAVVEFGRRSLLRGQRVVTRKVDRVLDVLNGQVGVVEGVELVTSKWTVELSSPSVYTTRRVFNRAAAAGETIPVAMSPRQVAREQAKATTHLYRRTELVDQARGRLLEAGESLRPAQKARLEAMAAQREDELAVAQTWHEWAQSLPSSGGQVSMTVASAMPKNEEERLVVRLDDDTRRYLPAAFVARHLDSGYAATTQRSQGQTVDEGLQYGQLSYVGLSRGRVRNVAHLVVAPPDPTTVERENEALAATRQWLARIIGEPETDQLMAAATARLRSGQPSPTEVIADQLAVTIQANADSQRTAIAEQVAQAHRLGERVLAVAKSREMAGDLSDAVVAHLVATGKGTVLSAPINGRSWVRGMPVVLARGEVSGLVHGATYYAASVAKSGLFLESDEDQRVQLSAAQVRDHLDPAFAVTAARAQQSIAGADRIVAVANGLSDEDLAWVSEQTTPVDVVLTDPEVAGEIAYQRACDAKITELLRRDCGAGWQSRSAHAMIDSQEQEIGLASLQAEIRLTAAACDEVRTSSPRDVARRDLEQEMIELRQRRAELELRSRTAADDDDQIDARWGIERLEAELAQLQLRYQVVTGELADDDPAVTRELAVSAARHGFDDARLVEAERRLVRYTQERVTSALKNPRPYHREISVDPSLDAAAAQAERLGLLIQIEQYRLRWAIDDLTSALGAEPSGGLQLDEWTKVVQRLGDGDRAWDARAR